MSANKGGGGIPHSHGHASPGNESSTYGSWRAMTQRCTNPAAANYSEYGGKGVKICERWREFANFLADMGERPEGKTLDRHPNNDGNYEPGNCRWATPKEQANNRSTNRILDYGGEEMTLKQVSELSGIGVMTLIGRLAKGMSVKDATSTPLAQRKISYLGQDRTVKEIAAMCGVKPATLWYRLNRDWPIDEAVSLKPDFNNRRQA